MNVEMKRRYLNEYGNARRDVEIAHVCVTQLEYLNGATPRRCIKQLQYYIEQALHRMDVAADKLGASYG